MTIRIVTLTEAHQPGKLSGFDATKACSWIIARAGTITGLDPAAIIVNDTGFINDFRGEFSVGLSENKLELRYAPGR